jgi:Helix-turn-helix domain
MNDKTERRFLRLQEVAARYRRTPRTIREWAASGQIPALRLSDKTLLFDPAQLAIWEAEHTSGVDQA